MRMIDADIIDKQIQEWVEQPGYGDYYSGYDAALYAVQDFVAYMPTLTPPDEWISVTEGFPQDGHVVVTDGMFVEIDNAKNVGRRAMLGLVTHWIPLPLPPDRRPPEGEKNA